MTNFAQLKNNRQGNFDKLREELDKSGGKKDFDDDRFWYPAVDKAGNGYAVIRFLPTPEVDGDGKPPFVRVFSHSFQGPTGSWYIENSLTTLGRSDPISDHNSKLWNSGQDSDKEIARKQKRKLSYISNIFVIEDPSNPENNGKVKLFKYGKQIFDVLVAANDPEFPDEKPLDPFDLWDGGANFKVKIRNKDNYRNYQSSEFDGPKALFEDENKMEAVWTKAFSLQEFVDEKNFKSYDELEVKMKTVLGMGVTEAHNSIVEVSDPSPFKDDPAPSIPETEVVVDTSSSEDEDFFAKLAEG